MVKMVGKLPNQPLAFGANCGVGASDLLRTVLGFAAAGPERPIIAKGNAGIPRYHEGHIHYDGTPELMAEYACSQRDAGATIIGGCCGTMPDHLRMMRDGAETRPRGERPALEVIAERLGGFSSTSDGTGDDVPWRGAGGGAGGGENLRAEPAFRRLRAPDTYISARRSPYLLSTRQEMKMQLEGQKVLRKGHTRRAIATWMRA
jgi:hypothetical protein